ncbi:hypothetical protein R1flu_008841 [Riccia fluitans]|uniref:Uncharacterized protein n=1 Tax=Riccia fluitans TaxID=41844 RepID=A0ABD1Z2Y8_9MARC
MEGERTVRYLDGPTSLRLCCYRFCDWDSYSSVRQKLSVSNPQQTVGSEATNLGVSCGFWLSQLFFQILAFLELQFSSSTREFWEAPRRRPNLEVDIVSFLTLFKHKSPPIRRVTYDLPLLLT